MVSSHEIDLECFNRPLAEVDEEIVADRLEIPGGARGMLFSGLSLKRWRLGASRDC
jgi:hypothetical protein